MKSLKIYLAGPIAGLSHKQASEWRLYAVEALKDTFEVFNPMSYNNDTANENLPNYNGTNRGKMIWGIDKANLENSDLILINFIGCKRVSIGTCVEVGLSVALEIPIVIVMEKDNVHQHPFIVEPCEFLTESLDEAIDYCKFVQEYSLLNI